MSSSGGFEEEELEEELELEEEFEEEEDFEEEDVVEKFKWENAANWGCAIFAFVFDRPCRSMLFIAGFARALAIVSVRASIWVTIEDDWRA